MELSVALSGYHIRTAEPNPASESIVRIDRTDVDVSIGYRLASGWEISFGAGFPLRNYVVESGEEQTSYSRYGDLDLMLGLRYRLEGGSP